MSVPLNILVVLLLGIKGVGFLVLKTHKNTKYNLFRVKSPK